jgi:hypothetical protein
VTVLVFSGTILLMGMQAQDVVCNANGVEEGIKLLIRATPIGLNCKNFTIKHALNKGLKFSKVFKHLRFMMKQINLCKFAVIINKTNIVFLTAKGINGRSPYIRENELQWSSGMTSGDRVGQLMSFRTKTCITNGLTR